MFRMYQRHKIRRETELSGRLWRFRTLEGEEAGKERTVMVPSCWESYPGLESYRGKSEYETELEAQGNVRLEFKGVSHKAWVYVDEKLCAEHYNAYTPFSVIVKNLCPGRHKLKVIADNSFQEEYALNRPNDYMSYGGITRGVGMEQIGEIYLTYAHITPLKGIKDGWTAKVEVFAENLQESAEQISLRFFCGEQEWKTDCFRIEPGEHCIYREEILFKGVQTWSLEAPHLYEVWFQIKQDGQVLDDLAEKIGFRTVRVSKNRVLINEKPVRIKGVCRHEDHPHYGNALPAEAIFHDLALIRDLGANSVRTAHYPNDERFLDLCDEMGILVWEEHHVRGGSEERMRNPYFEPQCEQVIREMIREHYNHPSIYIWGIMNECASDTVYGRSCYEKQYGLIRSLDTSRLCSSASCKYGKDLCMDLPDVDSWNMYPYWYEDKTAAQMIDEVYQWMQTKGNGAGKPFLITEIGAGAIYGFRSPDLDKWTEEYQAYALERQLTEVMAYTECMGLYIWQFCDIRVSKEWFAQRPRTRNNKGIVDEFRRRKLAYDVVKRIFHTCPDYWEDASL